MTQQLSKILFDSLKDTEFTIRLSDDKLIKAILIEVGTVRVEPVPDGQNEPFSLIFQTANDLLLEQQIYEINHPDIDPVGIFLVPLGPSDDSMEYEAVFT